MSGLKKRNTGKRHFNPVSDNDICIRATWSNFSRAINTESVCGCLIRSAGNGRSSSSPGPLSLLLQTFICRGQKDDFRRAEAGAIYPLELMLCKLLSLCKLSFQPSVGHCLASSSSLCCSMFYCPQSILGKVTYSLDISAQDLLGLDPVLFFTEVSRSLFFLFSLCICECE